MTDTTNAVLPGWHDDPADPSKLRWWNGSEWTAHLADRPVAIPTPPPGFASIADPVATQLQREAAYVPFQNDWVPGRAEVARSRRSTQTLPAWLLAFSPLWVGAGAGFVERLIVLAGGWYFPALCTGLFVVYALLFGLGWLDVGRLRDRGYAKSASPAWILLFTPVYFIIRLVRVGAGGVAPLVVNVVVGLGLASIVVAYLATLGR